jgi:predicted MPP superfamily phosphohydrolase
MKTPLFHGLVVIIILLLSCEKEANSELRAVTSEQNYQQNNKTAAQRLSAIMYNQTDSANPIERFKLVQISDAHLSAYSSSNYFSTPNNLLEAIRFANQQELRINALVATGDHISYATKAEARQYLDAFYKNFYAENSIPSFPCHGNHDANMLDTDKGNALLKSELYSAFNNTNYPIQRNSGENYYYADMENPMGGTIRIIALDMLDHPDATTYNFLHKAVFTQQQIDWLCQTALKKDMTDEHSVIIITHFPFESYSVAAKISTFLLDGQFVHTSPLVPEIIEAFREKKTLSQKYVNQLYPNDTIFVDRDFSSYQGDFICYLGGHIHATTQFNISNIRNQSEVLLPQKMLLCTNMAASDAGKTFNKVKREQDTLTDNSFCIYAIDTRERKIYITFFGAYLPSDQTTATYPDIQEIAY